MTDDAKKLTEAADRIERKPRKKVPVIPPELSHLDGWHFQYIHGWNACRKMMLGEDK